MDLQLKGKIVLVTGASRGLGYATALQFANEGAKVAINSRSEEKLSEASEKIRQKTGAEVITLAGDLTEPSLAGHLVEKVVVAWGGLDILVTNAGGPATGVFDSIDDAGWHQAFELSFLSQARLIRTALPYLRKSSHASVLTVTSLSVKQPISNLILSNSIRAATVGLTKSLALELGKDGIRFNSILPGWTETERVYHLFSERAKANGSSIEEEMRKQAQDSPLGRIGQPEEFAKAAVFLSSPAASFITGVMLSVDGGMYKGLF